MDEVEGQSKLSALIDSFMNFYTKRVSVNNNLRTGRISNLKPARGFI